MKSLLVLGFFMVGAAFFLLPAIGVTENTIKGIQCVPFGLFCFITMVFIAMWVIPDVDFGPRKGS